MVVSATVAIRAITNMSGDFPFKDFWNASFFLS
jgi:hypothetical protein